MMAKKAAPTEAQVQKSGIALLKAMGWHVWRRNVGGMTDKAGQFVRFGVPGMSDTWGFTPDGRHFELEFKREGKRPDERQLRWLRFTNNFGVSFWVDNTATLQRIAGLITDGHSVWYYGDGDEYDL